MEKQKNAYEIIGTSWDAIIKIHGKDKKDEFIRMKKNDTLKAIENKISIVNEKLETTNAPKEQLDLQKRLKRLEKSREEIENAYLDIANQESRERYDDKLDLNIKIENAEHKINRMITRDAYEILYLSRETCHDGIGESRVTDKKIYKRRNALIKQVEDEIERLKEESLSLSEVNGAYDYRKKTGIDGQIALLEEELNRIEEAYTKIATREQRKAYEVEREELKEQRKELIRQSNLRKTYKISQYYNPNSIQQVAYKSLEIDEKEKRKLEKDKKRDLTQILVRENGAPVRVERIGMLAYKNAFNTTGMLDAYRITRKINGKTKSDVRYTNLNMIDLSRDPKTGELHDKEYYNFVANVFLSEDSIEGSKYNNGYIGEVVKDKEGNYIHDLSNRDELSAVMKLSEEKENSGKENNEKDKKEIEGEVDER